MFFRFGVLSYSIFNFRLSEVQNQDNSTKESAENPMNKLVQLALENMKKKRPDIYHELQHHDNPAVPDLLKMIENGDSSVINQDFIDKVHNMIEKRKSAQQLKSLLEKHESKQPKLRGAFWDITLKSKTFRETLVASVKEQPQIQDSITHLALDSRSLSDNPEIAVNVHGGNSSTEKVLRECHAARDEMKQLLSKLDQVKARKKEVITRTSSSLLEDMNSALDIFSSSSD